MLKGALRREPVRMTRGAVLLLGGVFVCVAAAVAQREAAVSELEATANFWPVHLALLSASKLFDLVHDAIELVDEIAMIAVLPKRGYKGSVIPDGAVFFSTEPLEHFEAVSSKLSQNRTRVMQLIRR